MGPLGLTPLVLGTALLAVLAAGRPLAQPAVAHADVQPALQRAALAQSDAVVRAPGPYWAGPSPLQPPPIALPPLPVGGAVATSGSVAPLGQSVPARIHLDDTPAPTGAGTGAGAPPPAVITAEAPAQSVWRGSVGAEVANVRSAPRANAPLVDALPHGAQVQVQRWVEGDAVLADQPGWAQLGDQAYVYGPLLRRDPIDSAPALPADVAPRDGRWIDVNLTLQEATAYDGAQPVRWVAFSSGRPGWETRPGTYRVLRRVQKEDMTSGRLLDREASRATYDVKDVHWVQYFLEDGSAIHENYWRDPALFGIPSSHGCLGMAPDDARWFWDWATLGTPLVIHQ